jgi:DNA-binding transcriptional ArsR family regulator
MASNDRLLRLAKALSHPLRQRILEVTTDGEASPNEIARITGPRLGTVSYHVQVLLELECIELVRTARRRGATEHFYRATVGMELADAEFAEFTPAARRGLVTGTMEHIRADLSESAKRGGLDRADVHVSRTPLVVDRRGWEELSELLLELLQAAKRIQRASEERGDALQASELALLHFPTAGVVTPTGRARESR